MKKFLLSLFLMMFGVAGNALATSYYWNASTGDDSNNCSSGSPCKTFSGGNPGAVLSGLSSGDEVVLSGMFRPDLVDATTFNGFSGISLSSKSNITVRGDSTTLGANGISHCSVYGGSWTPGAGVYTTTTHTGLSLSAVTVNYGLSSLTDALGNQTVYTGILRKAATVGDVSTTTNSWFYNSGTGVITVNSSLDPSATSTMLCLQTDTNAIKFSGGSNNTVKDLITQITGFESNQGGYGVQGDGATNMTVSNMRIEYGGYHGIGFVGTTNNGNKIQNSYFYGAGNANHTQTVFYAITTRNVINALSQNNYHSIYGPVDPAGVMHTGYTGIAGSYCHTDPDGSGNPKIESYDVIGNTYVSITDSAGTLSTGLSAGCADPLSMPAAGDAEKVFENYNIRHSDINIYGALKMGGGTSGSSVNNPPANYAGAIAFRRVHFDTGSIINPYNTGVVWIGWASTPLTGGNPKKATMLIESSEFRFDLQSGGNFLLFFGGVTDNSLKRQILRDVTVIDSSARTGNAFSYAVNTTAIDANVNVFVINGMVYYKDHTSTRSLFAGRNSTTNAELASILFTTNNWYYNTGGTLNYVNNTSASPNMDTQAEYSAAIDPNGVYATLPAFTNASVNGEPTAGGNLRTTLNAVLTPTPGDGINDLPYGRNYGAWQYGSDDEDGGGEFGNGSFGGNGINQFGIDKFGRGNFN